jgi:hypothetical protein
MKLEESENQEIILQHLGFIKTKITNENISFNREFEISKEIINLIEKEYEIDFKYFNYKIEDSKYYK